MQSNYIILGGGYKEMNNFWLCLLLILYSFELRSKLHSNFAHRDYGYAIVPMYYIVFTIHRDTGKCRRLDVCCRQSQIDKQCCFAALSNKKSHVRKLACKDMAFLFSTTSWSLFIYLTLARYYSYSIVAGPSGVRS